MSHREVKKKLAQVHTASMQESQDSNPDSLAPESVFLTTTVQFQQLAIILTLFFPSNLLYHSMIQFLTGKILYSFTSSRPVSQKYISSW